MQIELFTVDGGHGFRIVKKDGQVLATGEGFATTGERGAALKALRGGMRYAKTVYIEDEE